MRKLVEKYPDGFQPESEVVPASPLSFKDAKEAQTPTMSAGFVSA
jgi:hypothetical protein